MTMRALVKETAKPGLTLKEVPVPSPGFGEVLIRVERAGICGTDLHIYEWDKWAAERVRPSLTIGHEFVGRVARLGEGVSTVKVGDRVSGEGHIGCGDCYCCRTGQGHICEKVDIIGVDVNGCFAEYLLLPGANVWKLDSRVSDRVGAILDPLGNAMHTVMVDQISGRSVLIMGVGTIGLMMVTIARAAGALEIFCVDTNGYKLGVAKQLGADLCLNAQDSEFEDKIRSRTRGRLGVDVLLEASGHPTAIKSGLSLLRSGGWAALLGIPPQEIPFDLAREVIFKGVTLYGINGRRIFETWYQCENFLTRGRLNLDPIITHEMPLQEFQKGFELMKAGKAIKVILSL
ncbi:MAG: L-threonine 3-dehydrogenase [Acidobacteriota bacterium]